MPNSITKSASAPDRRAEIADALLDLLATTGYDTASVGDIARAAGLAPGLVHYHFKDKAAILPLAMDRLAAAQDVRLADTVSLAGPDPASQIDHFIDAHLRLGDSADPAALAAWMRLGTEAMRHPALQLRYEAAITRRADRLAEILTALACPDPKAGAAALLAVIQGYFSLAASAPGLIPKGSAAAAAKQMAAALITPQSQKDDNP